MVDLMHACKGVPSVIAERQMRLAAVVDARLRCVPRPSWCALFVKAFGLVAERRPELRQAYFDYPWPHLYEHPESVASFTVERRFGNEDAVFFGCRRAPERYPITDLDAYLRHCKEAPLEEVSSFQRTLRLGRLPLPLRRPAWWLGLNLSGSTRARFFGTFAVTTTASSGAGMVQIRTPLTSSLHYGLLDDAGRLDVRLTFDHRVLDGAAAARALTELEGVLTGEIVRELRGLAAVRAA